MKRPLLLFPFSTVLSVATLCAQESPNVIIILADDLGYGDISCLNENSKINTPNIDGLGRNGIIFTDAHATSALSTPSRYSIMTGRYPWRTSLKEGVLGGKSPAMIPAARPTMASMFSKSGYNTACIGKWHLGWDWTFNGDKSIDLSSPIHNGPTERGFDYFFGIPASLDMAPYVYVENTMPTTSHTYTIAPDKGLNLMHGGMAGDDFKPEECFPTLIKKSIEYIDSQKDAVAPFFLYLPITAPHTPVLPTKEFAGKTDIGPYGDFVVMVDDMVGRIVKALKKNNQYENTIIVFASDNGCAPYVDTKNLERQGHYPSYIYRGYKSDIYEGGHRIPLIISQGGKPYHRTDDSLVTLGDLYATFAQMTSCPLRQQEAEDSISMWPLITEGANGNRDYLVAVSGKGAFSIRTRQYKLIFAAGSGGWGYPSTPAQCKGLPPMQLYDIVADAAENNNLIDDAEYADVVAQLTDLMRQCLTDGHQRKEASGHNDTADRWRQTELFE